jgi:hypothetical protein
MNTIVTLLSLKNTLMPRILAVAAVGTSSWRASPAVENASVDEQMSNASLTRLFMSSIILLHRPDVSSSSGS